MEDFVKESDYLRTDESTRLSMEIERALRDPNLTDKERKKTLQALYTRRYELLANRTKSA